MRLRDINRTWDLPTLYTIGLVQGSDASDAHALAELGLPVGEAAVEIAAELLVSFDAGS